MSWGETLFLKKVIDGRKRFVSGTSPIAPAFVSNKYYSFNAKLSGLLTVTGEITNNGSNSRSYNIQIQLIDGTIVINKTQTVYRDETYEFKIDFPVVKGNVYKIKLETSSSSITVGDFYFCGQVTDYNYFESEAI